jgi:hypothetical protein
MVYKVAVLGSTSAVPFETEVRGHMRASDQLQQAFGITMSRDIT